jgi:peptide/nickel transport system permease protein
MRRLWEHRSGRLGLAAVATLVFLAAFAPWLAPYDPTAIDSGPLLAAPSRGHWMGTDGLGRDVWSRWLFGARLSLSLGAVVMVLSTALGGALGSVAGFFGGVVDRVVVFLVDLMLSVPRLVIVLAVAGLLRWKGTANLELLVVILALTSWMGLARVVRAEVASLAQRDFVTAVVALGLPRWQVLIRHVLPHTLAYFGVFAALAVGHTILAESTLSYLGLGVTPPTPSWGTMVADGSTQLRAAPWLVLAPGLGITGTVLGFNLLGDGLRDLLDPHRRGAWAESR